MRGRIVRVKNTRLGLTLSANAIGYCLVQLPRPGKRENIEQGDPLSLARRAAREWRDSGQGALPIMIYGNDEAFVDSVPAGEGLTREQHILHVNLIAAKLADEGFDIIIREIE